MSKRLVILFLLPIAVCLPVRASASVMWYSGDSPSSDYTASFASPVSSFDLPYTIVIVDESRITLWSFPRGLQLVGAPSGVSIDLDGTAFNEGFSLKSFGPGIFTLADVITAMPISEPLPPGVYSPHPSIVATLQWAPGTSWPDLMEMATAQNSFTVTIRDAAVAVPEPGAGLLLLMAFVAARGRRRA